MNPNAKDLLAQSLKVENDFSSSTHAIDTLAKEVEPQVQNFEIPTRYNKDTLRIILVNTQKYYIYWEVSDQTLKKYNLDLNIDKLQFIVKDKEGKELFRFESSFALGEYYLKTKFENMLIGVSVEIEYEDETVELLNSNMIQTFSSKVNLPSPEDEVWIKKSHAWTEVVKSTMSHFDSGISSAQYVQELERVKHFSQIEEQKATSNTMIKEN